MATPGEGIPNARVTLTDTSAENQAQAVVSNGLGYLRVGGPQVGQTYTIHVESRGRTFTPLTVSVKNKLLDLDMIAQQ